MPTHGGRRPQVTVTTTLADLGQRVGVGRLNTGDPISIPRLLAKAAQVDAVLAVFGHHGEVLHYGRSRRLAPAVLRKALEARDQGCAFPGCDAAPQWTDAHHVLPWSQGGTTDIDTMALNCRRHHTRIHQGEWTQVITNGVPQTIPPSWVDKKQRPRRNHAHAPP